MSFTPTAHPLVINWNEAAKRLANVQLEEWTSQNESRIAAVPGELDAKFSEFTLEWKRLMMEAVLAETLSCHNLYLKRAPGVADNRFFPPAILHNYVDTSPELFVLFAGKVDMDLMISEVTEWLQSLLPQAEWHTISTILHGDISMPVEQTVVVSAQGPCDPHNKRWGIEEEKLKETTSAICIIGVLVILLLSKRETCWNQRIIIGEIEDNYSEAWGIKSRSLAGWFSASNKALRFVMKHRIKEEMAPPDHLQVIGALLSLFKVQPGAYNSEKEIIEEILRRFPTSSLSDKTLVELFSRACNSLPQQSS